MSIRFSTKSPLRQIRYKSVGKRNIQGYLTVYLALLLGVMSALCLALTEGVRVSTMRMEAVCISDIASDSILAEYHRELFWKFNLLALDSSYGTGKIGSNLVEKRLKKYLEKNLRGMSEGIPGGVADLFYKDFLGMQLEEAQLEEAQTLTDEKGAVFRRQAVSAIRADLGAELIARVGEWFHTVREQELDVRDVEAEKREADEKIASAAGDRKLLPKEVPDGPELPEIENPTEMIEKRKRGGIVQLVLGDKAEISGKRLRSEALIMQRMRDGRAMEGNMESGEDSLAEELEEKILFQEYLIRYFGCYTEQMPDRALDYEVEYLIAGKNTDSENIQGVLNRLLAVREAANVAFLYSDRTRCEEADLAALGISSVLMVPELQPVFKTAILLGWAYAESVHDLKILTGKGRVPLLKDDDSWHSNLADILSDIWKQENVGEGEGLCYQDYLGILLLLTEKNSLTERAMNLVEADIRLTSGNESFRLDGCLVKIGTRVVVKSSHGGRVEVQDRKKY